MAFDNFGIYFHVPYCLQICPYCDFTKYEFGKIMPPAEYVGLLQQEIRSRAGDVPSRNVGTVYFGGGTPSLFEPELILTILAELAKEGFRLARDAEVTIEIDPATVDEKKLNSYLEMGINRFSVGAQTFNERLLKTAGRKHSMQDTIELLSLLKRYKVNYSFDLLFALPSQTLAEVRADVATALSFEPSHLSAYCLTVPEGHSMSFGRAPEEEQTEMFDVVESTLAAAGISRYEISNFARPGSESRHNMLYWTDQPYWGLGTSAHSYFPPGFSPSPSADPKWGMRFWNSRSLKGYESEIKDGAMSADSGSWRFAEKLPEDRIEKLLEHQSLTDFCHTSLRLMRGLEKNALRLKFGETIASQVGGILTELTGAGLVEPTLSGWRLSRDGRLVANSVFERLTFLPGEIGGGTTG